MEKSVINLLEKFGYKYQNGIVTPPTNENTLDAFQLNYELDDLVFEEKDFMFSYELIEDNGLKLIKNEL